MKFEFLLPKRIGWVSVHLQFFLVALLYLITLFVGYAEYKQLGTFFGYPLSISILFVPIYEELIFRGLILENAQKSLGVVRSILLVSILFGLWHLKNIFWLSDVQLIRQVVYTSFIISPVFCWITLRTKSIWPAVILHYLNNILSSAFLLSLLR